MSLGRDFARGCCSGADTAWFACWRCEATPLGEIQQGSFQGGNRREDGFLFVQRVILQFHQGVQVTPATGPRLDNFDPEKVLWA